MLNIVSQYIGIDISKLELSVSFSNPQHLKTYENNATGIGALLEDLSVFANIKAVCYEATGIYFHRLELALHDAGYNLIRVDPYKAYSFRRYQGVSGKTDTLDAYNLMQICEDWDRPYSKPIEPTQIELRQWFREREKLIKANKLFMMDMPEYAKGPCEFSAKTLKMLEERLEQIEIEINKFIKNDDNLREVFEILTSIPSIGKVVAFAILAYLPEIGTLSKRQIGVLAGLAPIPKKSGTSLNSSQIRRGRKGLHPMLYMASMSATCHNPVIKKFAEGLKARGVAPMKIRVAVMHKLIVYANAMVRQKQCWDAEFISKPPIHHEREKIEKPA